MRNVVLIMSVSVDGFVAGPHGHTGAMPEPEGLKRWKLDRIRRAGTHINLVGGAGQVHGLRPAASGPRTGHRRRR